ncbi:hypothetical protein L6R53_07200 [Myxococcota bacterium]|nr:hypothetical protein [Myxococcota bacterium]
MSDAQPLVPMLIRLVDRQGEEIGTQQHGLPLSDLQPHTGSTEALATFVSETLMPQLARATVTAFLDQVPEEHQDAAFEAIGQVVLTLGHGTPHELTWTLQFSEAGPLEPGAG